MRASELVAFLSRLTLNKLRRMEHTAWMATVAHALRSMAWLMHSSHQLASSWKSRIGGRDFSVVHQLGNAITNHTSATSKHRKACVITLNEKHSGLAKTNKNENSYKEASLQLRMISCVQLIDN
jgi:hypothetical protein